MTNTESDALIARVMTAHRNGVLRKSSVGDALTAFADRVAALEAEVEEQDQLREKLVDLLTRTAAALKGEPEPNTLHSWHDLPELARAATERAQALHAALRELVAVWDTGMNVNPDDDAPAFHEWNARFDKAWEAVRAALAEQEGK